MNRKSIIWMIVMIGILFVYGMLDPDHFPFPQCPFLNFTGWKCPGCGSQRALHQFLHGHFINAFQLNVLFIPALGYVLAGYVVKTCFPAQWPFISSRWYGRRAALLLLITILVYWISRNL